MGNCTPVNENSAIPALSFTTEEDRTEDSIQVVWYNPSLWKPQDTKLIGENSSFVWSDAGLSN